MLAPSAKPEALLTLVAGDAPQEDITRVLASVRVPDAELQGPSVLYESLEWRLSQRYWQDAGCAPFAQNSVPYMVNNSGRLSANAARLLFENLSEHPPTSERIEVLELGAGCGLFARLFLDAFRSLCEQHGADYYDRLRYVVSDSSRRTLEDWFQSGLFDVHTAHVLPALVDALEPTRARLAGGEIVGLSRLRAVFCNYVLDVLPATVWRVRGNQVEELHVTSRWCSPRSAAIALPNLAQLREQVASGEVTPDLLGIWSELDFQTSFAPARVLPRWDVDARAVIAELPECQRLVVSFGALDCLTLVGEQLEPAGLMLVNDYGSVDTQDVTRHATPQRFGQTVALGLHFPLLERCFRSRGYHVIAPPGDEQRGVHTRLLSRNELPVTEAAFALNFARTTELELERAATLAREHFIAGRHSYALDAYRDALTANPGDWQLLGEVAEFVGLTLHDFEAGAEIARRALALNAWTSSWLWNVLGDCFFCLERHGEAHAAFLEAQRIDATDVRTNYSLSQSHALLGETEAALGAIARALVRDTGLYRARLLQQQEHVLAALAARREAEHTRLAQRLERFGAL